MDFSFLGQFDFDGWNEQRGHGFGQVYENTINLSITKMK